MYLTENEAVKRLGYKSGRTLRRKVKAGELKIQWRTNPNGKNYRYKETDVALVEKQFTFAY